MENEYKNNISFKKILSINAGGNIKTLFEPRSIESLIDGLNKIKEKNEDYYIIGNGTNVVASDKDYNGTIIYMKKMPKYLNINNDTITVSASYNTSKLVLELLKLKIGNLEFLSGIPGSIGGAVIMNAGAFNNEIKDFLISIRIIEDGIIKTLYNEDLDFSYRNSNLKNKGIIIIDATFKIQRNVNNIELVASRLLKRKKTQPLDYPNVGSVFKNPNNIKAWELIDGCNLRMLSVGGMMVSRLHANFLINYDNGTAKDFYTLMEIIKNNVYCKYHINLESEILFLNF